MAAKCGNCGASLGMFERARGHVFCASCQRAADDAQAQYLGELAKLADPATDPPETIRGLVPLEDAARLPPDQRHDARLGAVTKALEVALADQTWTEEEEARIASLAAGLGLTAADVTGAFGRYSDQLALGRVNAGRLEPLVNPQGLLLKRGEEVYLQTDALLLKEVVDREMRGGYRGVSIRVAKGVRFNTGGIRAHSVVIGSHMEVADRGVLSVTSQRVVFAGARKAIEVRYERLLGLQGFSDGIGLQIANRASEPVLKVPNGALVAATIQAAVSRL